MIESLSTTIHTILVDDISSELDNAKLVVLQFPRYVRAEYWYREIATQVTNRMGHKNPQTNPVIKLEIATDESPNKTILRILDSSDANSLEEAIESLSLEVRPLFVCLDLDQEYSDEWCQVLEALSKAYANVNNPDIVRPLLFFTFGFDLRTRLRGETGLRIIDFWNIYPPNDLRSLAHRILSTTQKNPFEQLWRESSYTAIANGDRHFLEKACLEAPNTLDDLFIFVVNECRSSGNSDVSGGKLDISDLRSTSIFIATEIGQVPTKLRNKWESGEMLGLTATGGAQHSWYDLFSRLLEDDLRKYLHFLIWQEQVVGFFPLLIRLSTLAAQRINSIEAPNWTQLLPKEYRGTADTVEPSVILETFREYRHQLSALPRPLNNLLHSLRKLRNKLAHAEAIERRDVIDLWEKYSTPRLNFHNQL